MSEKDQKLLALLDIVIDQYINNGDPVGSKLLNSLENIEYAPSTLRKYLNVLENEGLLYQPYNSSGRVPTVDGLAIYLDSYLAIQEEKESQEVKSARKDLRQLVEDLGNIADGVVVGFLRNDEYYYLGINNLLKDTMKNEYESTRYIVKFIEERRIMQVLDSKMLKKNKVYYTFLEEKKDVIISCIYAKINIEDYEWVISIIGPARVNYKHNLQILQKIANKL